MKNNISNSDIEAVNLKAAAENTDEQNDDTYYENYNYTVDIGQSAIRIDKFLQLRMDKKASRNKIQNAIKAGAVLVNNKLIKVNYKVKPLDKIEVVMPKSKQAQNLIPEPLPLNIVYEDDAVMVINKEAGMVVHPGCGNYSGTLVHGLLHHFGQLPVNKSGSGVSEEAANRPGLVHRIDKNTSGLMVVAKTEYAMTHLAKQFFNHTVLRRYQALVWGDFDENEGTITGHIARNKRNRKIMDVYPEGDYGKHAVTHYKVLERMGYVSLVECRLETGRTHQIRVHFKYIKHPLFNDQEYGGNRIVKGTVYSKYKQFVDNAFKLLQRQALHAKILGFVHPNTGENLYFESELPSDMAQCVDKWRKYMQHKI